ncbi:hypothetical protein PBCV1_a122/123bL [Paramecium bursaria Chlorella virus 1]|uniref:Uncharacterized protein n=1 Tax=Paramecium bursaria Chlorella virus 1 TaxID=10506 RepID=F8TTY1_PBCV1|nr:hypothetical protein PBCV1_a122/123bL [Paramecium bursaria Chlorella virus 1]AEI70042.1 hypothetical protein [Paramecium bursaria Chlorella virus 1]
MRKVQRLNGDGSVLSTGLRYSLTPETRDLVKYPEREGIRDDSIREMS